MGRKVQMVKSARQVSGMRWPWFRQIIPVAAALLISCSLPVAVLAEEDADSVATTAGADGAAASGVVLSEYLIAGDDSRVRIILHFDTKPDYSWFLLRSPHRLVLDLPRTDFGIDDDTVTRRGLVTDLRYGNMAETQSRMIFSAKGPFKIEDVTLVEN